MEKKLSIIRYGEIKLKGKFNNGVPLKINYYWENGEISIEDFYEKGLLNKSNNYNRLGQLKNYDIIIRKKDTTITKSYDVKNNLIDEIIEYH